MSIHPEASTVGLYGLTTISVFSVSLCHPTRHSGSSDTVLASDLQVPGPKDTLLSSLLGPFLHLAPWAMILFSFTVQLHV